MSKLTDIFELELVNIFKFILVELKTTVVFNGFGRSIIHLIL